jgi:uncharacterized protein DUF6328
VTEPSKEKTDRQLLELLNELRVALPGAQVLLGFLLTVPFATRFGRTSHFDRAVLFACMMFTTVGVLLLLAPSVYHRVRWNQGGKQDVVLVGHRLFLVGTACLAVGLVCAVFLLGDVLFGLAAAIAAAVFITAVVLYTWYLLPVRRGSDPEIRRRE